LAGVPPALLIVPFALIVLDQAVRVLAWRILLVAHGARITLRSLAQAFAAGTFLGVVSPSSLGTDVARVMAVASRPGVSVGQAASSLVVQQLFGLSAASLLGGLSAVTLLLLGRDLGISDAVLVVSLTWLTLFGLLLLGRLPPLGLSGLPLLGRVASRVEVWYSTLQEYATSHVFGWVGLSALTNQVLLALAQWTLAQVLGLAIPFWIFIVTTPIVHLSRYIPLSFQGFGLQQGVFVYLVGEFGVAAPGALAVSLLYAALNTAVSLFCGLYYAAERSLTLRASHTDQPVAEPAKYTPAAGMTGGESDAEREAKFLPLPIGSVRQYAQRLPRAESTLRSSGPIPTRHEQSQAAPAHVFHGDIEGVRQWYDDHAAEFENASTIEARFIRLDPDQQRRLNEFNLWALRRHPALSFKGKDVLEFGAGHGRLAFEFPDFASYTGVDLSPKLVAVGGRRIARAGMADRARLVVANCLDFDGPIEGYDIVGSLGMFTHVADPEAVLEKMVSHLRPGGWLFLDAHHASPLYDWIRGWIRSRNIRIGVATGGPVTLISAQRLRDALHHVGLRDVEAVMREYPLLDQLYARHQWNGALTLRNWLAARPLFDPFGTDLFGFGRKRATGT
jgi:glycosyltransferase 2 family protein